jgi:hypothetical protein
MGCGGWSVPRRFVVRVPALIARQDLPDEQPDKGEYASQQKVNEINRHRELASGRLIKAILAASPSLL